MCSLFASYYARLPEQERGVKRIWIESEGVTPGRWGRVRYTLEDAVCEGLFEFNEEGGTWNFDLEEWIPNNTTLRDEAWLYLDQQPRSTQIEIRDADLRDFRKRLHEWGYIQNIPDNNTRRRLDP